MQPPPGPPYPGQPYRPVPPRPDGSSRTLTIVLVVVGVLVGLPFVLGILAAIAIPAFLGYIRRAKVAEAETNIVVLARNVEAYCQENGALPGPAGPVPPAPGPQPQPGAFAADPVFARLGFAPAEPVYFSYEVVPSGADELRIVARGDLDGDLVPSERSLTCRLAGCTCGRDIEVDLPME